MSQSHFTIEEDDIVKLESVAIDVNRRGWINVGTHAVLIELYTNGQLSVEVCARTNEGPALSKAFVSRQQSLDAGGVDPDAEDAEPANESPGGGAG